MLVGRGEDLIALRRAGVGLHLVDLRPRLILACLEAVDLGLRGFDEEIELADLGGDLLLFGPDFGAHIRGHRQVPISVPLIHPWRMA